MQKFKTLKNALFRMSDENLFGNLNNQYGLNIYLLFSILARKYVSIDITNMVLENCMRVDLTVLAQPSVGVRCSHGEAERA